MTNGNGTQRAADVVRRQALPELTKWFQFLNGGYAKGIGWHSLLASYVGRIGEVRAGRLRWEAHDAQRLPMRDAHDSSVLMSEGKSPERMLNAFEQALSELVH